MPSWHDLKRYCERNGWILYKDTDHYFYKKIMPNGEIYLTKVSKGSKEIGEKLFKEILKRQLHISLEEFNKGK